MTSFVYIVFLVAAAFLTTSSFAKENEGGEGGAGGGRKGNWSIAMTECAEKDGVDKSELKKLKTGEAVDAKVKCVLNCAFIKIGIWDASGNINTEKAEAFLTRRAKGTEIEEIKSKCLSINDADLCEKAYKTKMCPREIKKNNKKQAE